MRYKWFQFPAPCSTLLLIIIMILTIYLPICRYNVPKMFMSQSSQMDLKMITKWFFLYTYQFILLQWFVISKNRTSQKKKITKANYRIQLFLTPVHTRFVQNCISTLQTIYYILWVPIYRMNHQARSYLIYSLLSQLFKQFGWCMDFLNILKGRIFGYTEFVYHFPQCWYKCPFFCKW